MQSWNRAALPQQRVMAASCGNFTRSMHCKQDAHFCSVPIIVGCLMLIFNRRTAWHHLLAFLLCSFRQHLSNGQIVNAGGKKCLGAEGDTVVLTGCDSGSTWETQGNGALSCLLYWFLWCFYPRVCRPIEIGPCWKFLFEPEWARRWRGRCRCAWCHNIEQLSRCCCTWRQHGRRWELENFLGSTVCIYVLVAVDSLLLPCRRVHWAPQAQLQ